MDLVLDVDFNDFMTPKSCSMIIKQLIKYILYNTQQIPYTYDGVVKLINCTKDSSESLENSHQSMKIMRANRLYKDIEKQFNYFESTFKSIEEELEKSQSVKEVILILGTTLLSPKHIFRLKIPLLSRCEKHVDSTTRKNLCSLYRLVVKDYDRIFSKVTGPTNTFILLRTETKPESDWFVPKHNFNISGRPNSITFAFNTPDPDEVSVCEKIEQDSVFFNHESQEILDAYVISKPKCAEKLENEMLRVVVDATPSTSWYQAKEAIKGFKDFNIEGVSVFNMIADLNK